MPDEVTAVLVQHSGGARAAAVFLSARVLQPHEFSDDFRTVASSFGTHRGAMLLQDERKAGVSNHEAPGCPMMICLDRKMT